MIHLASSSKSSQLNGAIKVKHSSLAVATCFVLLTLSNAIGQNAVPKPALTNHPSWELLKRLDKRADIAIEELPLRVVVSQLNRSHGLRLRLDDGAFEESAVEPDTIVNLNQSNVTIRHALLQILNPLSLRLSLDQSDLLITTNDIAEDNSTIANYPVIDLIQDPNSGQPDGNAIIHIIQTTTCSEMWEQFGGRGSIDCTNGILTISQQLDVHWKTAKLIDKLRELAPNGKLDVESPPRSISVFDSNEEIQKKLSRVCSLSFNESSLGAVIAHIRSEFGLPILVDSNALKLAGIDPDVSIKFESDGRTVGQSLKVLASRFELRVVVHNGCVFLTTADEAEQCLETRLYPMAGIARESDPIKIDYDTVIDLITTFVAPNSWEEVGGTGSVSGFVNYGCLVISQPSYVHEEIQAFLLDYHRKLQDPFSAKPHSIGTQDDDLITYVYQLPDRHPGAPQKLKRIDPEVLGQLIINRIRTESWASAQREIVPLPDRILIRNKHIVHKEIQSFLDDLAVYVANPYGRWVFPISATMAQPTASGQTQDQPPNLENRK